MGRSCRLNIHEVAVLGPWQNTCCTHFCKQLSAIVCADQNVSVDSPYFWNEAFTLRRTETGDVACPEFLQPLVEGILSTGKSLILLRAHQDLHTR